MFVYNIMTVTYFICHLFLREDIQVNFVCFSLSTLCIYSVYRFLYTVKPRKLKHQCGLKIQFE